MLLMVDFTLPLGYNKTVTIIHYTKKLLGWGKIHAAKKYSRVIACFAKEQGISLDAALDFFYRSEV